MMSLSEQKKAHRRETAGTSGGVRGMRRKGRERFGEKNGDCHDISSPQTRQIRVRHPITSQAGTGTHWHTQHLSLPLSFFLRGSSLRSSSSTTDIIYRPLLHILHTGKLGVCSRLRRGSRQVSFHFHGAVFNELANHVAHSHPTVDLAKFGAAAV